MRPLADLRFGAVPLLVYVVDVEIVGWSNLRRDRAGVSSFAAVIRWSSLRLSIRACSIRSQWFPFRPDLRVGACRPVVEQGVESGLEAFVYRLRVAVALSVTGDGGKVEEIPVQLNEIWLLVGEHLAEPACARSRQCAGSAGRTG